MDCSLLGSSVHGIFRATVLEQGAMAFSHVFPSLFLFYHKLPCKKEAERERRKKERISYLFGSWIVRKVVINPLQTEKPCLPIERISNALFKTFMLRVLFGSP